MIDVTAKQIGLKKAGFYKGLIDGYFGAKSLKASDEALESTGIEGIKSWRFSLKMVALTQWLLKQNDIKFGKIDGVLGTKTKKAIDQFLNLNVESKD